VVWLDNFQLYHVSIRLSIDGWCSMYCCRVLARRAGDSVVIALVLLNIIFKDYFSGLVAGVGRCRLSCMGLFLMWCLLCVVAGSVHV
jgi:hypothetical protein